MTKADKEGQRKAPILRFKGFTDAWEQRQLQNQVQFFSGLTYSPSDVKDVGTFVIRSSNIKDSTLISADNVYVNPNIANSEPVKKDDVIMVVRNGSKSLIGKHALVTRKIDNTVIGAFMTGIRSSTPYFLDALLDTINFKKEIYKNLGATINQITIGNLRKMTFKVPNKSEKFKIGNLFKKLNYLLALYERKLKLLSQIKKYFLDNLFAEKEYPNLRFKGFTDAWEQRKLGEVATFINGRAYKQNELLDSGKYKVLRVGNFYTNDSWYYSNLELADKYYIDKDDLVYTWSATFGPHIWNGEKVIYHYHIWKIELSKFLDRDFTLQILEADKAKLLANTNGSTMIHVTKKDMESKVISLPTIEEQKQIGLYLTKFDTLITLYENKQQHLTEIKKNLLNTMFI